MCRSELLLGAGDLAEIKGLRGNDAGHLAASASRQGRRRRRRSRRRFDLAKPLQPPEATNG